MFFSKSTSISVTDVQVSDWNVANVVKEEFMRINDSSDTEVTFS